MTVYEFVENLFNEYRDNPKFMNIEIAKYDLKNFKRDGWDLPKNITPMNYMKAWNQLVKKQKDVIKEHELN